MKIKLVLCGLIAAVVLSSCVSIDIPYASNKSFPSDGKYEIMGPVTYTARQITILGLFSYGGAGYMELYDLARIRHRADDVVSVSKDVKFFTILGIYTVTEYTLRGIAIRYIKEPSAQ